MGSQKDGTKSGIAHSLTKKRAKHQRRLQRKRLDTEGLHQSCIAHTARRIHWDCALAIKGVRATDVGSVPWRNAWLTAISLLRAIGHAMKKEDAGRSTHLATAVQSAWQRWKIDICSSQMFHGFIEGERNSLLKEYRFWNERKVYPIDEGEDKNIGMHLVVIGGQAVAPDAALRLAWKWWKAEIARIEGHAADLRQANRPARSFARSAARSSATPHLGRGRRE
jgi:hypothetical protein